MDMNSRRVLQRSESGVTLSRLIFIGLNGAPSHHVFIVENERTNEAAKFFTEAAARAYYETEVTANNPLP